MGPSFGESSIPASGLQSSFLPLVYAVAPNTEGSLSVHRMLKITFV
jgi:hypothetical protein